MICAVWRAAVMRAISASMGIGGMSELVPPPLLLLSCKVLESILIMMKLPHLVACIRLGVV